MFGVHTYEVSTFLPFSFISGRFMQNVIIQNLSTRLKRRLIFLVLSDYQRNQTIAPGQIIYALSNLTLVDCVYRDWLSVFLCQ